MEKNNISNNNSNNISNNINNSNNININNNIQKNETEQIFVREFEIIDYSEKIIKDENISEQNIKDEYKKLSDDYSNLLKQTIKLTNISDNSQRKLRNFQIQLQEQHDKIAAQNQQLKELNATKDKFFSIISHDLRNPITSILMVSEVLKITGTNLSNEQILGNIYSITESTRKLFDLFENLLRWARCQTGSIEFEPEVVSLNKIINSVIDLLNIHATNKKIELIKNIPDNIDIFGDSNMLETIIRNLVSNSIKFTPNFGKIIINYNYDINSNNHIITISDTGIGISKENINKLFKIDSNIKSYGTANESGTGLGLILCKEFVEKHGGEIKVESELNVGSKFIVQIPKKD